MQVGDWIFLKGKSGHGKNRVHEHGQKWIVESVSKFNGQPALSLRSENRTFKHGGEWIHDARWVLLNNDPNFEIMGSLSN